MGFFGRTLSRLDEVKRALSREPGARQFLAQSDELRRKGQVPEAIEVLEKGLEQSPGSVAGHVALGRLLQQTGRLDPALLSYQAALKLDPQNLVALRQTADVHLSRGEKVEAIKKLKLFRGLSPGDREVNELIRQLDEEIGSAARGAARPETQPHAVPATPPRTATGAAAVPPVPPVPALHEHDRVAPLETVVETSRLPDTVPEWTAAAAGTAPAGLRVGIDAVDVAPGSLAPAPAEPAVPLEAATGPAVAGWSEPPAPAPREPEALPAGGLPPHEALSLPRTATPSSAPLSEEAGRPPFAPVPGAAVTETLAELLRSQGHLAEARDAYAVLAHAEPDESRARRFRAIAEEISSSRTRTPRGRLEAWAEPFARLRGRGDVDLVAAVEEVVRRLGPAAAVVTDLEGVPVVSAGPRSETEAMENLAAELTAFWKNVRRSRAEIGKGSLDSLVLSGSAGTAAVKVITPSYALLLKAGAGVPAGRIRFEAARAAEQLRPALF